MADVHILSLSKQNSYDNKRQFLKKVITSDRMIKDSATG